MSKPKLDPGKTYTAEEVEAMLAARKGGSKKVVEAWVAYWVDAPGLSAPVVTLAKTQPGRKTFSPPTKSYREFTVSDVGSIEADHWESGQIYSWGTGVQAAFTKLSDAKQYAVGHMKAKLRARAIALDEAKRALSRAVIAHDAASAIDIEAVVDAAIAAAKKEAGQ